MKSWKRFAVLGLTAIMAFGFATSNAVAKDVSLYKNSFKSDFDAWRGRGGSEKLEVKKVLGSDGALVISNRNATWNGPIRLLNDVLTPGATYRINVKVSYLDGPTTQTLVLSVQQPLAEGGDSYTNLQSAQVAKNKWTTISVEYTAPANVDKYQPSLYFETPWKPDNEIRPDDLVSICIDEVEIIELNATPAVAQKDIPALHKSFKFPFGAAARPDQMSDASPYNPLLRHFKVLVAENEMKQENLQPSKGKFTFENADKIVNYAQKNNMKLRGHVLVWHSQVPAWFFEGSGAKGMATKDELYKNMKTHIDTVLAHYKGKIDSWDVVNECLEEDGTLRNSKYLQIVGSEEYIENAFRWAREADPNAKLFLNDYGVESAGAKQDGFYELVKRLLAKGVPIDGVGFQCHISMSYPSVKQIKDSIDRFAALGLKVQITELDVSVYASDVDAQKPADNDLLTEQAYYFKDLFTMFEQQYKAKKLDMVMMWGISDDCSWLNDFPVKGRKNYPLFFDHKMQAKPAYWIFVDKKKVSPRKSKPKIDMKKFPRIKAKKGTPTIDGELDAVWQKANNTLFEIKTSGNVKDGSTFKVLWDEKNLYVFADIKDDVLNDASANDHEQDSVEIFIDQKNDKAQAYGNDDGQYRVNFKNRITFNGGNKDLFKAVAKRTDTGYIVEAACPLDSIKQKAGTLVGFDIQINEADKTGTRVGVSNWANGTNLGYRDTSSFGIVELSK